MTKAAKDLSLSYISVHKFSGTLESPINSQAPKVDMKQTLYWGLANILLHRSKFRSPADLAPGNFASLLYFLVWRFNWRFTEYEAKLLTITSLCSKM